MSCDNTGLRPSEFGFSHAAISQPLDAFSRGKEKTAKQTQRSQSVRPAATPAAEISGRSAGDFAHDESSIQQLRNRVARGVDRGADNRVLADAATQQLAPVRTNSAATPVVSEFGPGFEQAGVFMQSIGPDASEPNAGTTVRQQESRTLRLLDSERQVVTIALDGQGNTATEIPNDKLIFDTIAAYPIEQLISQPGFASLSESEIREAIAQTNRPFDDFEMTSMAVEATRRGLVASEWVDAGYRGEKPDAEFANELHLMQIIIKQQTQRNVYELPPSAVDPIDTIKLL